MDHLRSFINSRLSTLAQSYDHRKVKYPINPEQHQDADNPESQVMAKQAQQQEDAWMQQVKDRLLNEIINDELLLRLHDVMEQEEIDKPADLALRLSLPVETIKNAKKRIRRAWLRAIDLVGPHPSRAKEVAHG
jgi:hypothetical protein